MTRSWRTPCSTPTADAAPEAIWFNLALTVAVMVLLVLDVVPLPFVFMVGAALALVVNFPKVGARPTRSSPTRRASSASSRWCSPPAVLVGVLNGTGMVTAMADGSSTSCPRRSARTSP